MAIIVDQQSRILIQGITGPTGRSYAQRMVANGTPLVAGVAHSTCTPRARARASMASLSAPAPPTGTGNPTS